MALASRCAERCREAEGALTERCHEAERDVARLMVTRLKVG